MASIRRTLSPAYADRCRLNGAVGSPLSPSYPKLLTPTAKTNGVYGSKQRKGLIGRRSLYRCLLFFVLGAVLGASPLGHVGRDIAEAQAHDIEAVSLRRELQIRPPRADATRDEFTDRLGAAPARKLLIVVTPTYVRASQAYFLSRIGQALKEVAPPVVWVVVETGEEVTVETAEVLRRTGLMYRHLATGRKEDGAGAVKDRGVHQRNAALEHIEKHKLDGIVYFADDDNVYSSELFERLRDINRFGTWPVVMLAQSKNKAILEGPVCNGSQVVGWHTNEKSKRLRRFHVDMSGFAFNSTMLWDQKRWGRSSPNPIRQLDTVKEGFQETTFMEQVVEDESQMEGVPTGCSKILNWHLHLDFHDLAYPSGWLLQKNLDVVLAIK